MKSKIIILLAAALLGSHTHAMTYKSKTPISPTTPICGVLSPIDYVKPLNLKMIQGTDLNKDFLKMSKRLFIVPKTSNKETVARYHVIHEQKSPMPLEAYGPWWACVTKGWILQPVQKYDSQNYGWIGIQNIKVDQNNFERGME